MAATVQSNRTSGERAALLPYAGFQMRSVAFILDLIVLGSFFLLFFTIAFLPIALAGGSHLSDGETRWVYVVLLSYIPFVPLLFFVLWAWRGQSIGMMATRIEVTDRDGEPLSVARALLRTLVWPLCMFPFAIGAVPIPLDDERRALQDMIAGTVVLELP